MNKYMENALRAFARHAAAVRPAQYFFNGEFSVGGMRYISDGTAIAFYKEHIPNIKRAFAIPARPSLHYQEVLRTCNDALQNATRTFPCPSVAEVHAWHAQFKRENKFRPHDQYYVSLQDGNVVPIEALYRAIDMVGSGAFISSGYMSPVLVSAPKSEVKVVIMPLRSMPSSEQKYTHFIAA